MEKYKFSFLVDDRFSGERVDVFLSSKIADVSRSEVLASIKENGVFINGISHRKGGVRLKKGDRVDFTLLPPKELNAIPQDIPIEVVYEDEFFAIINKRAGMVVHPAPGNYDGTVVNAILHRFKNLPGFDKYRPGIVHRLDKLTSGLLVIPLKKEALEKFSLYFRERKIVKKYMALLYGKLFEEKIVELSISRDKNNRVKMAVNEDGKFARTLFKPLKVMRDFTLTDVEIYSGRTHQIRVHSCYIKHPVVGDDLYCKNFFKRREFVMYSDLIRNLNRYFLHAYYLKFRHPISDKIVEIEIELPKELKLFVDKIIDLKF